MSFNEDEFAHKLLLQLQDGYYKAIGDLYVHFRRVLYSLARNKGLSHEDAEDVVEDTFHRIIVHIDKYEEGKKGGWHWVKAIFYHVLSDRFRNIAYDKKWVDKVLTDEEKETIIGTEESNPAQVAEIKERNQALIQAWKSITIEDQKIILSRFGKRGPAGRKWEQAVERLRTALQARYPVTK